MVDPLAVARDRAFECELTRQLAGKAGVDVEPLNVFAGRRADAARVEYGHDFPAIDRNFERETLEELADARNYLVWRLEAIHRGLDREHWRVEHLQQALRYVALAFEEVRAVYAQ